MMPIVLDAYAPSVAAHHSGVSSFWADMVSLIRTVLVQCGYVHVEVSVQGLVILSVPGPKASFT